MAVSSCLISTAFILTLLTEIQLLLSEIPYILMGEKRIWSVMASKREIRSVRSTCPSDLWPNY